MGRERALANGEKAKALFEVEGYVFIAEGVEEICELGFGVGLGGGQVVFGEAVEEHLIAGFAIKSIMGLGGPLAGLVEGLGLGLVDDDLGEGHLEGVALDAYCVLAQILHIDAETEGAIIDTYQLVIGEETLPDCVDHLLGRDGQELPLTNSTDRLDLSRGGIDSVIGAQLEIVVLDAALDPEENNNNSDNNRNTYDELNVLRHT